MWCVALRYCTLFIWYPSTNLNNDWCIRNCSNICNPYNTLYPVFERYISFSAVEFNKRWFKQCKPANKVAIKLLGWDAAYLFDICSPLNSHCTSITYEITSYASGYNYFVNVTGLWMIITLSWRRLLHTMMYRFPPRENHQDEIYFNQDHRYVSSFGY